MKRFEFQITEKFHKKRLDTFLFDEFKALSKAYLRRCVKEGNCEVNGYVANRGIILKMNDFVEVLVDINQEKGMRAENLPLDIIFEDKEIIVVDKSAGMLVHPTNFERNGTLLNGLTFHLNKNAPKSNYFVRPHLVHRLDRETSGLMVIAKNPRASKILCSHFKRKLVEKKYLAMVKGVVNKDFGEINVPIGRDIVEKRWKIDENGKPSQTRFKVIERFSDRTLLELEPITGRTNQLRIHCNYIGHTILGDAFHNENELPRLYLHASKLTFWHPNGERRLEFESSAKFENLSKS